MTDKNTMNSLPPSAPLSSTTEQQAEAFASDPRIHINTVTKRWEYEDDDGNEFEYDALTGKWIPLVTEDLVKAQQAAYSIQGIDEEAPAAPVLKRLSKKRKEPEDYTSSTLDSESSISIKRGKKDIKKPAGDKPSKSKNTAVFVTGLPPDAEIDELIERFSKCGVLEEDDDGEPKVKLYANEDGSFSGEALIVYFKEESVALAVAMLDDAELRIGDHMTRMNVSQAEFKHKNNGENSGNGEVSKPRKTVDKKKVSRRLGKMQKKLEEWDSGDEFGPSPDPSDKINAINKNSRVVVLRHMFTIKQLEEDVSLLLDLKEDVREECSTLGEVTNVVLYDNEPDGIMTVKFRDSISAQACVLKMNGRFFDGRRVEASLYNGKQRFRRNNAIDEHEGEGDEAEKRRLDEFAQWLLTEGD